MSLEIYFRRDIANILRATAYASEGSAGLAIELLADADLCAGQTGIEPSQAQMLHIYRQGVRHALLSVGLAFGLEPVGVGTQPKPGAAPARSEEQAMEIYRA